MHLSELRIANFRKLRDVRLSFEPGLNVVVGPNNIGKTAIVDALRALLTGHDEPFLKLGVEDIHINATEQQSDQPKELRFDYVFRGLDADEEADFMPALTPAANGSLEAHFSVRYLEPDRVGRLKPRRTCGTHDVSVTPEMLENLRSVYLPPLRDAAQGLKPNRSSQLARLLSLLADDEGRSNIEKAMKDLDDRLRTEHSPILEAQKAIGERHSAMMGSTLAQLLQVGLSTNDFQRLASRLSLTVDAFEIEQNGLGFNNLIYMAVVLCELAKNTDAAYRSLIVEEPEAHLHPQLQNILLRYLSTLHAQKGERSVQIFVTTHSPNLASSAALSTLTCLVQAGTSVETFAPRTVKFGKGKREKLQRYLDVTRAEIFFARRIIFVEGIAELIMLSVLAERANFKFREHGVSMISVEGLNFDSFLPLYGSKAIKMFVSVVTDADPQSEEGQTQGVYPALSAMVTVSDNTANMKKLEDTYLKVFHGVKTLEYDLALHADNRAMMLATLKELHPRIAEGLEAQVAAEPDDAAKAKALFRGMFERPQNNVQKGKFAQALAQALSTTDASFTVPEYIKQALAHACQPPTAAQ